MKTKNLIVGSVLVAVGVGAYFFLFKNKNAKTVVSTGDPTLLSGATNNNTTITESEVLNSDQINYNKALDIQKKYIKKFTWHNDALHGNDYSLMDKLCTININNEINPLGYKLKDGVYDSRKGKIVKLTL